MKIVSNTEIYNFFNFFNAPPKDANMPMAMILLYMVLLKHKGPIKKVLNESELLGVAAKTKIKDIGIHI